MFPLLFSIYLQRQFVALCNHFYDHCLLIKCFSLISFSASQLLDWHLQLDRSLPAPLDMVGAWLHQAEGALRQEIIVQQAHDETANTVHRALEQHKVSMESNQTWKRKLGHVLF